MAKPVDKAYINSLIPSVSKWVFISDRSGRKAIAKCKCGYESEVYVCNIHSGKSTQCFKCQALKQKKNTNFRTHGLSKTKLYNVWCGIKRRCYNKSQKSYKDYGGKGIRMCDEWFYSYKSFHDFCINNGYKEGLEIDRIDSKKNYEPENCRFIGKLENILRASKGIKKTFEQVQENSLSKLPISIDEIDDLIECALSGLFTNKELANAVGIARHTVTKIVKRYGHDPVWSSRGK